LEKKRKKIEKAVFLSRDRYCGVSAMLSKTAEMVYNIHLEEA
jgi:putative redox protein